MSPPKETTATSTSITTTTSTTTTSTTPVKVVNKNNSKVEEIKETTTTTTKTTTIVTPIKEESKKKIIRNKVWNDNHRDCVQLTRDFAHGRFNAKTKATEIHADPNREYYKYNLQTIQRKVREIRLHVKAYHKGVWLREDPLFREQCQLHVAPTDEEKKGREEEYRRFEELQRDVEDVLGGLGGLEL